jgi:hypothetical protein
MTSSKAFFEGANKKSHFDALQDDADAHRAQCTVLMVFAGGIGLCHTTTGFMVGALAAPVCGVAIYKSVRLFNARLAAATPK